MSTVNWTCYRCGAHATTHDESFPPNGWNTSGNLCPYCSAKEADKREAEREKREAEREKREAGGGYEFEFPSLGDIKYYLFAIFICAIGFLITYLACEKFDYDIGNRFVHIPWAIGSIIALCFSIRAKSGCLFAIFAFFILMGYFVVIGIIDLSNNSPTPQKQESPKPKQSAYLDGIDNISSLDELGIFYYDIAKKFNKNKMGLKGTPEQINAGNKLMVSVYDFLGTSAKNEDMLNVDSMKTFIKNFDPISDYRRKKAQEELQLGVEKIQSLNK